MVCAVCDERWADGHLCAATPENIAKWIVRGNRLYNDLLIAWHAEHAAVEGLRRLAAYRDCGCGGGPCGFCQARAWLEKRRTP
jgi:hypothetical protein